MRNLGLAQALSSSAQQPGKSIGPVNEFGLRRDHSCVTSLAALDRMETNAALEDCTQS